MLITGAEFLYLGNELIRRTPTTPYIENRRWRSYFGASANTVADVWNALDSTNRLPDNASLDHMLWTFMFLKVYETETIMAGIIACDEKTYRKWVWAFAEAIADLLNDLVSFESRLPVNHQYATFRCWISVDGTDFRVYEKRPRDPHLLSHKYNGAGLRYEIAVCIRTGLIVWVNGPFKCGEFPDLKIYKEGGLVDQLLPGELVLADGIYRHPTINKKHNEFDHPFVVRWKNTVLARQEHVNRRFKTFKVLSKTFRSHHDKHGIVFRASASIVQVQLKTDEPLFPIHDY